MAENDYHVIVYQILAYLYNQLKDDKPIDPEKLSYDGDLFKINRNYWLYILKNIIADGYIKGIRFTESDGSEKVWDIEKCFITPKGIEYLLDDDMIYKVREYEKGRKEIPPLVCML